MALAVYGQNHERRAGLDGRRGLVVVLAVAAAFHSAEGALVLAGVCGPPADYSATWFGGSMVPMLLVSVVVGGGALIGATAVLKVARRRRAPLRRSVETRRAGRAHRRGIPLGITPDNLDIR